MNSTFILLGRQPRKRRYVPHYKRTPDSVNKRNQRERTRTERLGGAFKNLQVSLNNKLCYSLSFFEH